MKRLTLVALFLIFPIVGWGSDSGFLDDYSILEQRTGDAIDRVYIAPGTEERLADYDAVLVDQPEVFMSPDSKYGGAKPDHLKMLADSMRLALVERLQEDGGYKIVEEAGPGVVYIRWAITDLYLKKKKRGFLSYTPIGFVVHATAQAAIRDVWKKIDMVELNIEVEFVDGATGDVLAAVVAERGARKTDDQEQELVSWEELDATINTFGLRLRCSLDNARIEAGSREDCSQILVEPVTEES
ncbi:MAG: DUF3313 domain-containing protein [Gammaproteobacteria bacterium]|nr:DUF3313 domain-containing protein [Gammaproteobacteria bacterium]